MSESRPCQIRFRFGQPVESVGAIFENVQTVPRKSADSQDMPDENPRDVTPRLIATDGAKAAHPSISPIDVYKDRLKYTHADQRMRHRRSIDEAGNARFRRQNRQNVMQWNMRCDW